MSLSVLLERVHGEAAAYLEEWGPEEPSNGTGGDNAERAADVLRGEVARAFAERRGTWRALLMERALEAFAQNDEEDLRDELLSTAAMAIAWVAYMEKRGLAPTLKVRVREPVLR